MALASGRRKAADSPRPERATPAADDVFEYCRGLIRWLFASSWLIQPPLQVPVPAQRMCPGRCYEPSMVTEMGCLPTVKVCQGEVRARHPEVQRYSLDCVSLGVASLQFRRCRGASNTSRTFPCHHPCNRAAKHLRQCRIPPLDGREMCVPSSLAGVRCAPLPLLPLLCHPHATSVTTSDSPSGSRQRKRSGATPQTSCPQD